MNKILTVNCIGCPKGCEIIVEMAGDAVIEIKGYACPRGKAYAESEVVCPKRIITTTVKTFDGRVVSVKTDKPVKKSEIFSVMEKIGNIVLNREVKINDMVAENITGDVNIVATCNSEKL